MSGHDLSRDWQSGTTILPIRSERGDDRHWSDCALVAQSFFTGRISKVFTPIFKNRFHSLSLWDVAIDNLDGFHDWNAVISVNNLVNIGEHSFFKRQSTQRSVENLEKRVKRSSECGRFLQMVG